MKAAKKNFSHTLLARSIAAAFAASAVEGGIANAADDPDALPEITVTAQRRAESVQDVPITIQAITGESLKQLNVQSFNDLIKYTPNVTFSGNGPGTGNIFMRGLSSGGSGNQSQSTTAPMPNVALYLDDQSMQFPARNNDVYMVDMERVEVLEGPQGTLFGGGAQAGVLRYITNKPKLNKTEGIVNAGYGMTAGGDDNSNLNAVLNVPIVPERFAVRAVVFSDHRGGYIDNVPGTIQLQSGCYAATCTTSNSHAASPVGTNNGVVGNAQNPVNYEGFRLSALWQINDDWSLLLQQNNQNFEADGYFYTEPLAPSGQALQSNQMVGFTPGWTKDNYQSTAWTLEGEINNDIKLVYTGSFMTRHIDGQQDYSNYLTSKHGSYYDCSGQNAGYAYFRSSKPSTCYTPIGDWRDVVKNKHQSHELRLTTSANRDWRVTGGAFYEKFEIYDVMNFNYMPIPQCNPYNLAQALAGGPDCVAAVGPIPGFPATDPSLRVNTNTAFGEDVYRGYTQTAAFASVDYDLIPKVLTLTAGTRFFKYDEFEQGSEYYSATSSLLNVANGTGNPAGIKANGFPQAWDGFGMNLKKSEHGHRERYNLTWHIDQDHMAYYTHSAGFRPGGFNRTATSVDGSTIKLKGVAPDASGVKQFLKPSGYNSDNLINDEIGFKGEFLDHRLQLNLSAYYMKWENVQLPLFDPVHLGNTTFDVNGPTYTVKGLEAQFAASVARGLLVQGSASYNHSEQTNAPCLPVNNPAATAEAQGSCITEIGGNPYTNPYGELGTAPAYSPSLMFNLRAKYDWTAGEYKAFFSVGANHTSSQRNEPASFPNGNDPSQVVPTTTLLKYDLPAYTTYDAAIGVSRDQWSAQLSGSNLSNSNAATNESSAAFIKTVYPLRPRVFTLQIGYHF